MGMFRKEGGGFLNGETATIVGYKIEAKEWNEGPKPYSNISVELMVKRDEAEEPVPQYLGAGFIYPDRGEGVSDDGQSLTGGAAIGAKSEFGRFLQTLVEARAEFEQEFADEDGNATNFAAMNNYRVTFGKEQDVERQMASGRKKLGITKKGSSVGKGGKSYTDEEIMVAGKRPDKNDKTKSYNQDRLIVTAVIGPAATAAAGKAKAAPKAAPVSTAAKGGKSNGAAKGADDYKAADKLLLGFLTEAKENRIPVKSINSLIVKKSLEDDMSNEDRDAFRTLLADATYLKRENGWAFDGKVISIE
jgi:hypothetical protein